MNWVETVRQYKNYKESKGLGRGALSHQELRKLREGFNKKNEGTRLSEGRSSTRSNAAFEEKLEQYRAFKFKETGSKFVTKREKEKLLESCRLGRTSRLDLGEVRSNLKEARISLIKGKVALREGDLGAVEQNIGESADALDMAVQDVQSPSDLPEDVITLIQTVKSNIDNLAARAGIENPIGLDANEAAGVPADTSAMPMDDGMLTESRRRRAIRERVRARRLSRKREETIEGVRQYNKTNSGYYNTSYEGQNAKPKAGGESHLPSPSDSEIKNGSKRAGKTWARGTISKKMESKMSLDEQMVDDLLNKEKLNFKEIFKKGSLLG